MDGREKIEQGIRCAGEGMDGTRCLAVDRGGQTLDPGAAGKIALIAAPPSRWRAAVCDRRMSSGGPRTTPVCIGVREPPLAAALILIAIRIEERGRIDLALVRVDAFH